MISVAMATFNGEKYVREQLESIIKQTLSVDEIVICDDCSCDNTIAIINEVIKKVNLMTKISIRLLCNATNEGSTKAFYRAILNTKGDYIFLADQDDIWESNKVNEMISVVKTFGCEFVCSNVSMYINSSSGKGCRLLLPKFMSDHSSASMPIKIKMRNLYVTNIVPGCTYCFSQKIKNIYSSLACFDVIHDYQLMLIGASLKSAYFISRPLVKYRIHENQQIGMFVKEDKCKLLKWPCHMFDDDPVLNFLKCYKKLYFNRYVNNIIIFRTIKGQHFLRFFRRLNNRIMDNKQ